MKSREVLCSNLGSDKKVLEHILIPGRFYGGRVRVIFLLSAAVQPGASIMRKMNREVLGSNPGPDRKSVRTQINSWPIPWGVDSGSFFSICSSSAWSLHYAENESGGLGFESRS